MKELQKLYKRSCKAHFHNQSITVRASEDCWRRSPSSKFFLILLLLENLNLHQQQKQIWT